MKSRRRSRSRKQFGGSPSVGFDGSTLMSASGVPIDIHSASDPHCNPPSQAGGRRRRSHSKQSRRRSRRSHSKQSQRGGGCGCNFQMGGNRSFGFELDPSLGKVYSGLSITPCPAPASGGRRRRSRRSRRKQSHRRRSQKGGSAAQELLVSAEPAGYSMGRPFTSSSASFLDPIAYKPTSSCSGGRRRRSRK